MLYDILIIDDDFSGETVLDEMALSSEAQDNRAFWNNTIMPFYFDLVRENLKVIWSTGELDDLKRLGKLQLSNVRYIICDLHLLGIDTNAINNTIVSKIMGILDGLKDTLGDNVISFLINSKYIEDHSGIDNDLQTKLNEKYPKKYTVTVFSKKNAITSEQKQELLDTSLLSHIKEQVIKKHLEVERHLDQKISMKEAGLKRLSFSSKHKIVTTFFDLNGNDEKIKNLNKARNYIAHNKLNLLADLKDVKTLKEFKHLSNLIDYLDEIDRLIIIVKEAPIK